MAAPRIGVIGAGPMGCALGHVMSARGAEVHLLTEGRSAASRKRVRAAGLDDADWQALARCDLVLSVVPPSAARPAADRLARETAGQHTSPLFIEANAIAPDTVRSIAARMEAAGLRTIDGGILGGPPAPDGSRPPLLYLSGPHADKAVMLSKLGLRLEILAAPIGAASALKMALAGVAKGQTALFTLMSLLARSEQVDGAFLDQLARSQPGLLAWGKVQMPQLGSKSARWTEETEVLAQMTTDIPGGPDLYRALGQLFTAIAEGDLPDLSAVARSLS